jgi:hypothetical protein
VINFGVWNHQPKENSNERSEANFFPHLKKKNVHVNQSKPQKLQQQQQGLLKRPRWNLLLLHQQVKAVINVHQTKYLSHLQIANVFGQ